MAETITRNLKLKIGPNTTADGKYNLQRIDTLAEIFYRDSAGNVNIRAEGAINLLPNNVNAGGSGSGGEVNFGSQAQPISTLTFHASSIDFGDASLASESLQAQGATYYSEIKAASSGQTANLSFLLPPNYGSSGQVLKTDGAGVLSWVDQSGGGGGINQMVETWAPADGDTKTVTHNWGTRQVMVSVLDSTDNYRDISVDISRPTNNTITLSSSDVPAGSWVILLQEVQ